MPNKSETPANVEDVGQPTREAAFAAPRGSAALVQHWRACAKGWADSYVRLRAMMPDAAERAKARVEVYEQCAKDLEESMRQNDKIRHDADSAAPQPKERSNEL